MFHQALATVNWTSNSDPVTMVPVGPDVLASLANNIVVCYNVKNKTKAYFKADRSHIGISHLTGHIRYPLFAVAEAVLRPRIFVISYPEMEKLSTIYDPGTLTYVDIKMSDFGYLVTLGDHPEFKLSIWNYRTGECYAHASTQKKCSRRALFCLHLEVEVVIQYSNFHNQIMIWELCHSGEGFTLIELTTVELTNDFILSNFFPVSYDWLNRAYVINDYGDLFSIEDARMSLKYEWSTPNRINTGHSLFFANGFVIMNAEQLYFIRKRQGGANELNEWYIEWLLQNPNGFIKLIVPDYNNNLRAATTYGNIYRIQYAGPVVTLAPEMVTNCYVVNYALFRGIRDEVVLLLTSDCDLWVVDLIFMNTFSKIHIDGASSIAVHNTQPIVAVGTDTGEVYFVYYEKVGSPVELGSIHIGKFVVNELRLYEHVVMVKDELNGLHILLNDYRNRHFQLKLSLAREPLDKWSMLEMFLLDEHRAIVFLSHDVREFKQYATEAWEYSWNLKDALVECAEYSLPYKYRSFTMLQKNIKDVAECMGVRYNEGIVDLLLISKNSTINIAYSFRARHFARVCIISGSRNILTANTQCILIHFRRHKKSKTDYKMSRALLGRFIPTIIVKVDECFNNKYLIVLNSQGRLICYRLPLLVDCLRKNNFNIPFDASVIKPNRVRQKHLLNADVKVVREITDHDLQMRELLLEELHSIEREVKDLIDYDISVIGLKKMNFRKFCLNRKWLGMLQREAIILCATEINKLIDTALEQARIRDWIFDLIRSRSTIFSTKLRSIYSNVFTESYTTHTKPKELLDSFDLFRFYDMEPLEYEIEELPDKNILSASMEKEKEVVATKALKRYVLEKDANVYEHVMAKDFELQDTQIVTFNQLYNEEAKQPIILIDALKTEFNKSFILSKNFKEETMDNVYKMNAALKRIYENMNCILCLLSMEQFEPPTLTLPVWQKDENIQHVLFVDDSEVKAINRHTKKVAATTRKLGRMLLWDVEFWKRALMVMMDGVVEKIWDEEIKKAPQPPEFFQKKKFHELTAEERKILQEYEYRVQTLDDDRRKYLGILHDNELKTYSLKSRYIKKLNEHISAFNILKMKYDFAIKHERLRLLNMKLTSFKRIESKNRIVKYREEIIKIAKYTRKYEQMLGFFERGDSQYRDQYELQQNQNRQLYYQFKTQFLCAIPQNLVTYMNEIFKKRPKLSSKVFSTGGLCFEVAQRVLTKTSTKFPLPLEVLNFLNYLNSLDSIENCPAELERRYWDHFTRLRRQKIEGELRLKGISCYLSDTPKAIQFFAGELQKLSDKRLEANRIHMLALEEYFDITHNQKVELILTLGQVEIKYGSVDTQAFKNSVLLHVDDVSKINELIKDAGLKKIQAMKRVALFRRKVTQQEWKYKMARASIEYLHYILNVIQNCKVTVEFRRVLRNWHRLKELKATTNRVGVLENFTNERLKRSRTQLERVEKNIDEVRAELNRRKRENRQINSQIEQMEMSIINVRLKRDVLGEEKMDYLKSVRMNRLVRYSQLVHTVRADYIKILELKAILDITRCRNAEILPPIVGKSISID